MTTELNCTALTYTGNGSNKWYFIVDLDARTALLGFGPMSPGASGSWSKKPISYARKKHSEKLDKGYAEDNIMNLPTGARGHILGEVSHHLGTAVTIDAQRNCLVAQTDDQAPAKPPKPKRPKADMSYINKWL